MIVNLRLNRSDLSWKSRTSLRAYINSLETYPFPRRKVIESPFFNLLIDDVVAFSPEQLELEIRYIVGLGPLGRTILLGLIEDLAKSSEDAPQ